MTSTASVSTVPPSDDRVLSGMRPTGALHLGHYHGALKNWVQLQNTHRCFFFVADWHALTTHYETPETIASHTTEMVIDWLAAGVDPAKATLFVQSRVLEHAELFLLLGMGTPLSWLERVPTYKDQIANLKDKDLTTYGFLGYPLLQAADILIYLARYVPVGADQIPHIEMSREIARRFNNLYGKDPQIEAQARAAAAKLPEDVRQQYHALRRAADQEGLTEKRDEARQLIAASKLSRAEKDALRAQLGGGRRQILREPEVLLTPESKLPGLDGRKMSKSYGNAIAIREERASVEHKVRRMPTDPARVKRTDPGNPERCPVWQFHLAYSDAPTREWVQRGCTTAGIGCLECKQPVIDAILREQQPMLERAQPYLDNPRLVRDILADGCDKARAVAQQTMQTVRDAMGLKG
ncbi:tryptophan--tRNA ligase [Thiomonas sp.]|uniref:tryptophan--tRNA ligase n=1 Tax=Thiomonas sp. TaxID=2047785 RepID=UPI0026347903|nr:tryptophan--tRNA ligase [Thiomonas sp.]